MARHSDDGCSEKDHLTTRRGLLKGVGVSALVLGTGVGTAGATSSATTVDLGAKGLQDGDAIDPYLESHFASETEVHVPAGEYTYTGSGLDGSYSKASLLGSSAGVVFHRPAGSARSVRPTTTATGGTVRIENLTIRGTHGGDDSQWRVGAAAGARLELRNVNMPDGAVEGSSAAGVYAGADHAGTLWVKACHVSDFGTALDVSDPYKGANGRVVVEDCDFVDNGITVGSDDSVVRGCYFEATETEAAPRAVVVDGPGRNLVIADCDYNWSERSTPIHFALPSAGGDGTIRDVRTTAPGTGPVSADWDVDSAWSGENIEITEV